jgi:biopolymer transport protein ExbD
MGFSVSMGGKEAVRSEPNVVPLCDVLLVLLIIFMIVTPLIQKGVDVRIPSAQFTVNMPENPDVVLAVKKDARDPKGYLLYVNQDKVTLETLQNALEEAFLTVADKKLYVKADSEIEYGLFSGDIWDIIRAAGIEAVGIITERKTEKGD